MLNKIVGHWRSLLTGRGGTPIHIEADATGSDAALLSHECIGRARTLRAQGEHRAALAEFERATGLTPDNAQAWVEQAEEHLALGEREDARDCYELALGHAPDCAVALLGLSRMAREAGDASAALAYIEHALQIAPGAAANHVEAALVRSRRDDLNGAIAAYTRAIELEPDNAAVCSNLGLLYLNQLGDAASAQRYFERAIEIEPALVAAQANLGLALEEQDRIDAALAHYEKLIAACPAESEYRWNRGLALLASGDYARGWEDYEMRDARAVGAAPRVFPFPAWQGEELRRGAALLIYGEQGLGDEVMFASCVPDLLARGINCVIECDLRLAGLFARSFPAARVHGAARGGDRGWLAEYPEVQTQIAIGSLPRLLRRTAADFRTHTGYLHAEPRRVEHWRALLARAGAGIKVGITWRGGTAKSRGALRSIPPHELAPVFTTPGVTFINLQRDAGEALKEIEAKFGISVLNFAETLNDVGEMAALLQAVDGVITADNTVAHLAGAVGCRTMIMLPMSADWRWRNSGESTPWYPSVQLYRRQRQGGWACVAAQIAPGLKSLEVRA